MSVIIWLFVCLQEQLLASAFSFATDLKQLFTDHSMCNFFQYILPAPLEQDLFYL